MTMTSSTTWRARMQHLGSSMLRQKEVGEKDMKTELHRVLTCPQLTLLGVGNTIGVGIYVMLGVIAKENAGPSAVFSFVAALFVTLMNALVYAEFATFVPQTGAAYVYIYKVIGEFAAFLIGWTMVCSYTLSGSVGARAWSGMLDSLFNHTIQAKTAEVLGNIQFGVPFAESLDILAFVFQIVIVIIVSCNVQCSSIVNTLLGILTSSVLIFVFIAGLIFGDSGNFTNADHGGFFPFGIAGVVKGASLALYATSGFEIVSLSAEEAKDPSKAVPRALVSELLVVGSVYIGAAIGMLFLIPYWLIDLRAPLPSAFEYSGIQWGKMVVTIGPLFGITNLQMLGLYGLSRVTYRMAKDGLFFSWFLKVHKRTGVPLNSVICLGTLISIFALLFDLSHAVKVTVLLMLGAYVIVGSALIKLKITESKKIKGVQNKDVNAIPDQSVSPETRFYDQEIVVSEYETCDSTESVEANTTTTDGYISTDTNALIDLNEGAVEGQQGGMEEKAVENVTSPLLENNTVQQTHGDVFKEPNTPEDLEIKRNFSVWEAENELKTEASEPLNAMSHSCASEENGWKSENANSWKHDQQLSRGKCEKEEVNIPVILGNSYRERLAMCLSPFVPGVISVNVLLTLHWICCVSLAVQINFGWEDLVLGGAVAVTAMVLLVALLVLFSVALWSLTYCDSSTGFQTPLMPLVPTLSVLSSTTLLLSAAEFEGVCEIGFLVLSGSVIYVVMVFMGYEGPCSADEKEQSKRLVGGSGEDADDEVESEDEF